MTRVALTLAAALGIAAMLPAAVPAAEPAKTIEEIAIEGEVRLPEVLFITTRDMKRPVDWLTEYLLEEEAVRLRMDQAPVRVLATSQEGPMFHVEPDHALDLGGEPLTSDREIEEESR